jgi:hypothetical protein
MPVLTCHQQTADNSLFVQVALHLSAAKLISKQLRAFIQI